MGFDEGIFGGLGFGMIRRLGELDAEILGQDLAHFGRKLRVRVDAGADRGAADGHVFLQPLQRPLGADDAYSAWAA